MQGNKLATVHLLIMIVLVTAGYMLRDMSSVAPTIGTLTGFFFLVAGVLNLDIKKKEKF